MDITNNYLALEEITSVDKARLLTCINTESGGSLYFPMVVRWLTNCHTECPGKSQSSQTSPVAPESNTGKGTLGKRKGQF